MKKLLLVMSAAVVLVACNSNPNTAVAETKAASADTAGLAAFNAARQEQALAQQIALAVASAPKAVAPQVRTVTRYVPVRSASKSSSSTGRSTANAASSNNLPAVTAPEVINSESANAAKEKKGISKAAKGAIIGGVAGAVGGAVINKKNRVLGAVIGGVAGAAGGAVIGRGMDKKDGRYLTPGFNPSTY